MKTIRTVIALLSLFISSAAFADSPVLIGKLYYLLDNKKLEAQITNSRDPDVSGYQFSSISIPSEVTYDKKKYKVTSIGTGAFMNSKVESVTVPNTVTDLSSNAFYMCYSLTSVTLPNGIKQIGYNAFSYCPSLKSPGRRRQSRNTGFSHRPRTGDRSRRARSPASSASFRSAPY